MSKTIKLEDKVYEELDRFQAKRETKSQAVHRLLAIALIAGGLSQALQRDIEVKNHQKEQLERRGADTTISTVGTGEGRMP